MNFPAIVKSKLLADISEMAKSPDEFVVRPGKDFSRNRKIDLKTLLSIIISMGKGTLPEELAKYFYRYGNIPYVSAFVQQRDKLKPEALLYLMRKFNAHFPLCSYKSKYRLIACDGSSFRIFRNPNDKDSFIDKQSKTADGFNELHSIALFDICSNRYLDAIFQPIRQMNEHRGFCNLIDRYTDDKKIIFLADRGFASYNVFAHAIENNAYFVIRCTDRNTSRMLKTEVLPNSMDLETDLILVRHQAKSKWKQQDRKQDYRYIYKAVDFDYIPIDSPREYSLKLRIVRFKISDDTYENIVTNLPSDEWSPETIKEIYHKRWDIETSFRDLKRTLGAIYLHSKKIPAITMEILARMILYNFSSIILQHISIIERQKKKHEHKINFSFGLKLCHEFFKQPGTDPPMDLNGLIGSRTLPIRPGRTYARHHRSQYSADFMYR